MKINVTPTQQQLLFSAAKALLGAVLIMALSAIIQQTHTGAIDLAILIDEGVTVFAALMGGPLYAHVPPSAQQTISALEDIVQQQLKAQTTYTTVPLPADDPPPTRLMAVVKPPETP